MFRQQLATSAVLAICLLLDIDSGLCQDCPENECGEDRFCNFDFGDSGFCEDCPDTADSCDQLGLDSEEGVSDCESNCGGGGGGFDDVVSPFQVFPVDDAAGCEIPGDTASKMIEKGFVKAACPFGVLVAGTSTFDDKLLQYGANVIANILDQDSDGEVDDPSVVDALTYKGKDSGGSLLVCGSTQAEERRGDSLGGHNGPFDYAFSCQTWKGYIVTDIQGIMMEEAFHMVHQMGYAKIYPNKLGMEDFTSSIVGREMARLQCVKPGWIHPENNCPDDSPREPGDPAPSPLPGTCNYPSCDIAEFYKMALFLAIGMGPVNDPSGPGVWMSDYMPGKQKKVLKMLSKEFKKMISDSSLHQITAPLTGKYPNDGCGSTKNKKKCNDKEGCSWLKLKGWQACGDAPTNEKCKKKRKKLPCKQKGCVWKNNEKKCFGRWD